MNTNKLFAVSKDLSLYMAKKLAKAQVEKLGYGNYMRINRVGGDYFSTMKVTLMHDCNYYFYLF